MSKYCKKCGKEVPQNSKADTCENCQNTKNGLIRRFVAGLVGLGTLVLSIVLVVITGGKFNGRKP